MELELPAEARALLDAVVAIGSDLDLRGVLRRIVETSCRLTGAEYGVLGTVDASRPFEADDERGAFVDLITFGVSEEEIARMGKMPAGHGLIGAVPQQRTPMRVDHVAEHPESVGYPSYHPPIDRFLGAPVPVGGQAFGHLYLGKGADDAPFTPTDQALVEALARAAGVTIANARAYEESERRRTWLLAAQQVSAGLSPAVTAEDAVQHMVASLQRVSRARTVAVVRDDEGVLEVDAVAGAAADGLEELLDAVSDEVRQAKETGEVFRLERGADRVIIVVPMRTQLARGGVLIGDHPHGPRAPRADELELVRALADQLGVALDRAAAFRERHELLLAKDRDRIARDLHDLVIQRIFATGMQLQGAVKLDLDELRSRVGDAVSELDVAIRDLRSTIFELGRGGSGALLDSARALLRDYSAVLGFVPLLRSSGPVDLAVQPVTADQLLLALREILSNVARHAQASSTTVELSAGAAWLSLKVTDDGRGFDADDVAAGRGLGNLRHRAESLGGELRVTSGSGGTTVEWIVPVDR
ncbi:signal transduction histidine kinase [Nocardioides thalensis]|uniref:Signal transduction histidine kinase n=1 Tax=Nocardioides thalensis TaxID=1914755 RepID=A0A853BZL1_9ACTN|nr:GAF domain-containing protein [Nocardioides thalensis]NYI99807.1 signal transduction histidine kinase [Nocardioides thalensis]